MKKYFIITVFFLGFLSLLLLSNAYGQPREAQIKAGFIYKFLFFTEWPAKAFVSDDTPIIVGIVGRNPFGDIFKKVEGNLVDGRKLLVKRFAKDVSAERLKQCHVLFISSSLKDNIGPLLQSLKNSPVLTVSEVNNFTHRGGMINFVTEGNKVAFVINRAAAERVGIGFRYRLLRLATQVVEKNS